MCLVEVEERPAGARVRGARARAGRLDERRDRRHAPHAHGDAARRAPEREPRRRPNELVDLAEELGAKAPFVLPDAKRKEYRTATRSWATTRTLHPLQPLRPLHAGGDDVLGADVRGRGGEARIVPTHELSWLDTECELCGGCLSVCPTGAIYEKFETGAPSAMSRRSRRRRRRARSAASAARSTSTSTRRRSGSSR